MLEGQARLFMFVCNGVHCLLIRPLSFSLRGVMIVTAVVRPATVAVAIECLVQRNW